MPAACLRPCGHNETPHITRQGLIRILIYLRTKHAYSGRRTESIAELETQLISFLSACRDDNFEETCSRSFSARKTALGLVDGTVITRASAQDKKELRDSPLFARLLLLKENLKIAWAHKTALQQSGPVAQDFFV